MDFIVILFDVLFMVSFWLIEGVSVGIDVWMVGVKIGIVLDVIFDIDIYCVIVVLILDSDVLVLDDSVVIVFFEGLLGGSFVEILFGVFFDYYVDGD